MRMAWNLAYRITSARDPSKMKAQQKNMLPSIKCWSASKLHRFTGDIEWQIANEKWKQKQIYGRLAASTQKPIDCSSGSEIEIWTTILFYFYIPSVISHMSMALTNKTSWKQKRFRPRIVFKLATHSQISKLWNSLTCDVSQLKSFISTVSILLFCHLFSQLIFTIELTVREKVKTTGCLFGCCGATFSTSNFLCLFFVFVFFFERPLRVFAQLKPIFPCFSAQAHTDKTPFLLLYRCCCYCCKYDVRFSDLYSCQMRRPCMKGVENFYRWRHGNVRKIDSNVQQKKQKINFVQNVPE